MNILVVDLGFAERICVLKECFPNVQMADIDSNESRRKQAKVEALGNIDEIGGAWQKLESLSIDYPKSVHLQILYSTGNVGSVRMDVVSRSAIRQLEIE